MFRISGLGVHDGPDWTFRITGIRNLVKLGAPDPEQRAAAALQATELLQRKGLSWAALFPIGQDDNKPTLAASDWRAQALGLAEHPDLAPDERTYVLKVAGWRAPGAAALVRLRQIAERVGGQFR